MSGPPIIEPIPYRIRIGVTGHRTLPDSDVLMAAIKLTIDTRIDELFDPKSREKVARARETKPPPVLYSVVSPLAEGADGLVARAVLSYEGARLQVVLPLKLDDYLQDFETQRYACGARNPFNESMPEVLPGDISIRSWTSGSPRWESQLGLRWIKQNDDSSL